MCGGPVRIDEVPDSVPARYIGGVHGVALLEPGDSYRSFVEMGITRLESRLAEMPAPPAHQTLR